MPKTNQQPVSTWSNAPDELAIVDAFATIQGEGPNAGTPAVFVRLAGCNLQCPLCDTDYTSNVRFVYKHAIASLVADVWNQRHPSGGQKAPPLVVFTGGEPLRQRGLTNAIIMLMPLRMIGLKTIEIDTNGTYSINDLDDSLPSGISDCMSYVISPKTMRINRRYPPDRTVFKYVVSAANVSPDDGLPNNVLGQNQPTDRPIHLSPLIYVQPQDDKDPEVNARNRQTAIESCMRFGYRLSLQTQKILDLP